MLEEDSLILEDPDESTLKKSQVLARHILQERHRLGGDFVVAFNLNSQLRDTVKEITGPDTIFIVLCLDAELRAKHLEQRLPKTPWGQERLKTLMKSSKYQCPTIIDELNTFNVQVTESKTPNDLAKEILSLVENNGTEIRIQRIRWTEFTIGLQMPYYGYLLLVWIMLLILYFLASKVFGFWMFKSCQRLG